MRAIYDFFLIVPAALALEALWIRWRGEAEETPDESTPNASRPPSG